MPTSYETRSDATPTKPAGTGRLFRTVSATFAALLVALLAATAPVAQARTRTAAAPTRLTTPSTSPSTSTSTSTAVLKEISYYPAQNPWGGMWTTWIPGVIATDMAKIAALGANTVRIFVQPAAFGYPTPQGTYMSRLEQFVSIAAAHGLKVHLTLFDLWSSYGDITGSERWAAQVLAPFKGDPRIAAVELQNEIDPSNAQAMSWARTLLPAIKVDSGRPVTISVGGWNSSRALAELVAALGRVHPDFYDLHFAGLPPYMRTVLASAKRIAGATPLLIGEAGYSTDPSDTVWIGPRHTGAAQEQAQARYLRDIEETARAVGLPLAGVWNLNDFPALPNLSAMEQHYGLYRLDGTPKPAAGVIRWAFTSHP
jgi:hypothetical protein